MTAIGDPSGDVASDDGVAVTHLLDAVVRLERAVTRIGNKRLDEWNLGLSGYAAMRILKSRPGLSLAQLSRRCFVRSQTMIRIVSQLEARGLIAKSPHPESERAIALELTDEGASLLVDMNIEVLKINDTLLSAIEPRDIAKIEKALRACAVLVEDELKQL